MNGYSRVQSYAVGFDSTAERGLFDQMPATEQSTCRVKTIVFAFEVWRTRNKARLREDHPQHVFRSNSQEKFEYAQLLEYTQAQQTVGTPAFRRAFE